MAKVRSHYQGVDGAFYIVNPAGAIHSCDRNHVRMRLRQVGYRLAQDAEIEVYLENRVQRHNRPICEPWSPEPEIEADVPESQGGEHVEATEEAAKLAAAHGIDLARLEGSGAAGRILVKDVEQAIKAVEAETREQRTQPPE